MTDSDDELEKLREEKMEQLQDQGGEDGQDAAESRKKQIKQQAAKYLTDEAQSRLGNIRAADQEKASAIEMQIARMGKSGRLGENEVTDDRLKQILQDIGKQESENQGDIKFRR